MSTENGSQKTGESHKEIKDPQVNYVENFDGKNVNLACDSWYKGKF